MRRESTRPNTRTKNQLTKGPITRTLAVKISPDQRPAVVLALPASPSPLPEPLDEVARPQPRQRCRPRPDDPLCRAREVRRAPELQHPRHFGHVVPGIL